MLNSKNNYKGGHNVFWRTLVELRFNEKYRYFEYNIFAKMIRGYVLRLETLERALKDTSFKMYSKLKISTLLAKTKNCISLIETIITAGNQFEEQQYLRPHKFLTLLCIKHTYT